MSGSGLGLGLHDKPIYIAIAIATITTKPSCHEFPIKNFFKSMKCKRFIGTTLWNGFCGLHCYEISMEIQWKFFFITYEKTHEKFFHVFFIGYEKKFHWIFHSIEAHENHFIGWYLWIIYISKKEFLMGNSYQGGLVVHSYTVITVAIAMPENIMLKL